MIHLHVDRPRAGEPEEEGGIETHQGTHRRTALPARTRLCYPAAWAALGIAVPITLALGGSLRPGDAWILPGTVHFTAAGLTLAATCGYFHRPGTRSRSRESPQATGNQP